MFLACRHRRTDLSAEALVGWREVPGQQLAIEPRRPARRNLLANRQIAAHRKRATRRPAPVLPGTQFDDRAGGGIAGRF